MAWQDRQKRDWAANKRFKISKFECKFPIARTFERFRARSRLYRSQIFQILLNCSSQVCGRIRQKVESIRPLKERVQVPSGEVDPRPRQKDTLRFRRDEVTRAIQDREPILPILQNLAEVE